MIAATENGVDYPFVPGTMFVEFRREPTRLIAGASGGCNGAGGPMRASGDRIEMTGGISGTTKGCDDTRLHAQDTWMMNLLQSNPAWSRSGARLTLEGGGRRIVAEASP